MELITLCCSVIVVFGFWVEFELALKAVVNMIRKSKFAKADITNKTVQHPVYMNKMPVCLAKLSQY